MSHDSYSGALYPTSLPMRMSGIFRSNTAELFALSAKMGKPSTAHKLELFKLDKHGKPTDETVGEGSFKALSSPIGPFYAESGNTTLLVARGTLKMRKETVDFVVWKLTKPEGEVIYELKKNERKTDATSI
ncbi:MAG: hypothetical protein AABY95_02370 [Pseudomonadota bacterium]